MYIYKIAITSSTNNAQSLLEGAFWSGKQVLVFSYISIYHEKHEALFNSLVYTSKEIANSLRRINLYSEFLPPSYLSLFLIIKFASALFRFITAPKGWILLSVVYTTETATKRTINTAEEGYQLRKSCESYIINIDLIPKYPSHSL